MSNILTRMHLECLYPPMRAAHGLLRTARDALSLIGSVTATSHLPPYLPPPGPPWVSPGRAGSRAVFARRCADRCLLLNTELIRQRWTLDVEGWCVGTRLPERKLCNVHVPLSIAGQYCAVWFVIGSCVILMGFATMMLEDEPDGLV